ncbi:diadenosine tetraphosphatase [Rickettsia bellii]|uniref:dihydrofolate reductase n=3 Tax=Rickettsia bellii TaxID=33990 RepID=Q1RKK0_RICBR|nr:dihydrofolate reductase [Rickettsia bellii]ABE04114.1 Dihydrofolate reductase [Rickettsia bellii RML369-C]ABV78445.1 Dihydrofolate reductase [Rickettsia bellii OSU 85-389]ARD86048.1 diadenosine tetraphosphatase [Rickettsia bellii]KJV90475.1 dihydrofolate reductase family protein [Rickettsia bellii str. RML An4]KJV92626.1 dihydrofolate reductase family protein [Rickettsia bellii str. RML Mogi]
MKNRKITGIMACDPKGVIGLKGRMPWSYPEEFEYFYQIVKNNIIVMGHKTFDSLPPKILQNCICIVFSRNTPTSDNDVFFVESLDEFWQVIEIFADKKIFMVGGAEIATFFLKQNLLDEFLLTRINNDYEGDAFFPLDLLKGWDSMMIYKTNNYQIYKFTKNAIMNI